MCETCKAGRECALHKHWLMSADEIMDEILRRVAVPA